MRLPAPPLLVITDRSQARRPLPDILEAVFSAGARWASLREKDLGEAEQLALAVELLAVARRHGAVLTLHGSAELAQRAGLDGVHLPAGADVQAARACLGPDALIGISIHTLAEAQHLDPAAVDYAIAGPAFPTASKPGYGPALEAAGIRALAAATPVPLIALGGIDAGNAAFIIAAGARGVAVMGGVMRSVDPAGEVARLLDAISA